MALKHSGPEGWIGGTKRRRKQDIVEPGSVNDKKRRKDKAEKAENYFPLNHGVSGLGFLDEGDERPLAPAVVWNAGPFAASPIFKTIAEKIAEKEKMIADEVDRWWREVCEEAAGKALQSAALARHRERHSERHCKRARQA